MDLESFNTLVVQLKCADCLKEVLDDEGKIQPSEESLEVVASEYPQESDAEKLRLAQADTLVRLAEKYHIDLP